MSVNSMKAKYFWGMVSKVQVGVISEWRLAGSAVYCRIGKASKIMPYGWFLISSALAGIAIGAVI